tara:strand:+ start:697 stop:984 length:288 start_codon:yes stop_codon:yes gene_type:complete
MAITSSSRSRKKLHKLTLDEQFAVNKKQSLDERKRYCAYCKKKFYVPTNLKSCSTWSAVGDRTHNFFCKENCAAYWAVEQLTQALEKDDWRIIVE